MDKIYIYRDDMLNFYRNFFCKSLKSDKKYIVRKWSFIEYKDLIIVT